MNSNEARPVRPYRPSGDLRETSRVPVNPPSALRGEWARPLRRIEGVGYLWFVLTVLFISSVAIETVVLGPAVIMSPWDVFILLGGAWRILVGQVPHTDFYNPIGALVYSLTALGMKIGGLSLMGYIYGNVIFFVVTAAWGAVVFFRKLSAGQAFFLTVFIGVLVVAPRPLGFNPADTTYAMVYNRYGWALLSILLVQLFASSDASGAGTRTFDAGSAGMLLGIIFFDKINFFIVGVAALALALSVNRNLRAKSIVVLGGFLLVCAMMWFLLRLNPIDYLRDLAEAAGAQSPYHRLAILERSVEANVFQIALITAVWLLMVILPAWQLPELWAHAARRTVVLGFMVLSALFLTAGNAGERSDLPLFLISGSVLLADCAERNLIWSSLAALRARWKYVSSFVIVFGVFCGHIFVKDLMSIANAFAWHTYRTADGPTSQRFASERLRDFVVPAGSPFPTSYWRADQVPEAINEGVDLLRAVGSPNSKVAVLALTDPFSFALGLTPPEGVPLWWDLEFSFSERDHPEPNHVFSDADFVMVPIDLDRKRGCCEVNAEILWKVYGDYVVQHFHEAARSVHWVLLEKNSGE